MAHLTTVTTEELSMGSSAPAQLSRHRGSDAAGILSMSHLFFVLFPSAKPDDSS